VAAQLEEIGDEKETAGAGGGQPTFEQSAYVVFDLVTSDNEFAWFAGAVEDFDLLLGQQARRERLLCQRFFLDRP
jgi:hypothetical protein